MSKLVGFIGKGGTGKTTLTALCLKYVLQKRIEPVLVIDSDPNSCLGELLSVKVESTIGTIRQELLAGNKGLSVNPIPKHEYCEYALHNAIVEEKGYDLLTMGRSDGPGCYCYINNIMKTMIERVKKNYKLVIVDCEAGLEHFSRRTLGNMDIAVIVSDSSRKGIITGIRQITLMNELNISAEKTYLIINNTAVEKEYFPLEEMVVKEGKNYNMHFLGSVRHDDTISEFERDQYSLLTLPDTSPAYIDFSKLLAKIEFQ